MGNTHSAALLVPTSDDSDGNHNMYTFGRGEPSSRFARARFLTPEASPSGKCFAAKTTVGRWAHTHICHVQQHTPIDHRLPRRARPRCGPRQLPGRPRARAPVHRLPVLLGAKGVTPSPSPSCLLASVLRHVAEFQTVQPAPCAARRLRKPAVLTASWPACTLVWPLTAHNAGVRKHGGGDHCRRGRVRQQPQRLHHAPRDALHLRPWQPRRAGPWAYQCRRGAANCCQGGGGAWAASKPLLPC